MKVAITTQKELKDPHLEIDINLETSALSIQLKYTCPSCAGYGCMHSHCDNSITVAPEDVLATLGPDAKALLAKLFGHILAAQPVSTMKSWLVFPETMAAGWTNLLEDIVRNSDGQVLLGNILVTSGVAVVDATDRGVEYLRKCNFRVNPNETKKAIGR